MSVGTLNAQYLNRALLLFIDTDGQLMVFGLKAAPDLWDQLRGHEDEMKRYLTAQALREG